MRCATRSARTEPLRALLDVNVLIALLDAAHQHHALAWDWLDANVSQGWASCPITQNGYLRIVSHPNYPNTTSVFDAMTRLRGASDTPHHRFWPDAISLLDEVHVDSSRVHGSGQLTDTYLLALAVKHQGRLVTFDRRIAMSAVHGSGPESLVVL
jgi:uncharacterized protein